MPQISFTQFQNELAQILGTHQQAGTKASVKAVLVSSAETKSEEEGPATKSKIKKDGKIRAQSSQIKDLHTKLDQAVAENSQIKEFLSPTSLQMAFTSTLQAAQTWQSNTNKKNGKSKPFLDKCQEPQLTAGMDSSIDPEKSCRYCKDMS